MYIGSSTDIGSIAQSTTRSGRATEASRVHKLNLDTPLPPQKVVLTVSTNKKQLIDLICSDLSKNKIFHHGYTQNNKLVVTGSNNTPVQISHGVVIYREDNLPPMKKQIASLFSKR